MLGSLVRRSTPISSLNNPNSSVYQALMGLEGGATTYAGTSVNATTALQIGAVMSCVRLIAETGASLPRKVYRRTADGREELRLPGDEFLWGQPNPETLGQFFWENVYAHLLLAGNAYIYTPRNALGKLTEMWVVDPRRVTPTRVKPNSPTDPTLLYFVDGEPYGPDELLHIPGFGTDGIKGLSVVTYARQTLGAALATEEFGARFFGQGTQLSGVLTTDQELKEATVKRLDANWKAAHAGKQNAHKVAILEGGLKWTSISVSPADAQFLEVRKFQRSEIASLFRVPPHLIGDVERSTSWGTGIEQQNIQFITYTLLPWLTRIEEAISDRILAQPDRFFKFSVDALLRGTLKERYDAYRVAREGGWLSVNDILKLEDRQPIANGDDHLQPLNYAPLGSVPQPTTGGTAP